MNHVNSMILAICREGSVLQVDHDFRSLTFSAWFSKPNVAKFPRTSVNRVGERQGEATCYSKRGIGSF